MIFQKIINKNFNYKIKKLNLIKINNYKLKIIIIMMLKL